MSGWDTTGHCGCDQWGRCLIDCPTAHLPYRDTPLGRQFMAEIARGRERARAVLAEFGQQPTGEQ